MSLVPIGDSQIPSSYVEDSQPMMDLGMPDSTYGAVHDVVGSLATTLNQQIAKNKAQAKATMKWLPFMSTFVLKHMTTLIRTGVRTDKGFKEVHLKACAKALFAHCGAEVTSTQVYNHLRKWRLRWVQVSKLRDLSGAQWCEETHTIILEDAHYTGHIMVSTCVLTVGSFQTCTNHPALTHSSSNRRITPKMLSFLTSLF